MPRPYRADTGGDALLVVTLSALALAGPAAAATPRFGVFDLQSDLAAASTTTYGDVAVKPRAAVAGHGVLAHCGSWCRFGSGWLAFGVKPALTRADVTAARARVLEADRLDGRALAAPGARRPAGPRSPAGWPSPRSTAACRTCSSWSPRGEIAAAPLSTEVIAAHGGVTLERLQPSVGASARAALR